MEQVRIAVDVNDDSIGSLWDWLRNEPALRGLVYANQGAAGQERMGGTAELIVLVTSGATALTALARGVSSWLVQREIQRRSDVGVTVQGPSGHTVRLDAQRVAEPEKVLGELRELLEGPGTAGDDDP